MHHNLSLRPCAPSLAARLFPLALGAGSLFLFAGCATEPDSHLVSAPPPPPPARTMTTSTTTVSPSAVPVVVAANGTYIPTAMAAPVYTTTVVTQAPPSLQQEPVLAQPSTRHVWLPGYWTWRNERYEWMAGRWDLPPNSGATWIAPRWEQQGNAYRFFEGYWN